MRTLTVVLLLMFVACVVPVGAESIGLIPTLTKDKPKLTAPRADPAAQLPGQKNFVVVGFETFAWFGPDSAVGGAITAKHEIGTCKTINGTFYAGGLLGFSETPGDVAVGGFLQIQIGDIPSIMVLVRPDNGRLLINPGFNLTLIGWQ